MNAKHLPHLVTLGLVLLLAGCSTMVESPAAPAPPAFALGRMAAADEAIETAIEAGDIPGAVLLVGLGDRIVYHRTYGHRAVEPEVELMSPDTIFDHASLTKPLATATAVMILVDRGLIDLDEPVASYLPSFGLNAKERITVAQLLLHHGGLPPANPLAEFGDGPEAAFARMHAASLRHPPGERFIYTDVGYMILGNLVEAVDGRPLDQFAHEEIYQPLGMIDTRFAPPDDWRARIAPTERRGGRWIRGDAHDPRAYALGGVAGHAGLFGTAEDLARYCRMILNQGELDGRRILSAEAVEAMTRPHTLEDDRAAEDDDRRPPVRSYAFDVDTAYSSPRGERFTAGESFGHTGFTGTSFWIVPEHDAYVILLTNRVHPDGSGRVVGLRRTIATIAADAVGEAGESAEPQGSER